MKKELLSPVGNMESLYQAIHNGADAVYLGGKKYGARMFSDNFTNDELVAAINYCHLYGVKIYITINTVIFNNEVNDFLDYVEFIYKSGVDAVIMQDLGMIALVKDKFPDLTIHASTQTHNYNSEGIKLLQELGVERVVLARELSLDDIKEIDCSIDKEIFIHGALCISFSGGCLFSSMCSNRSGNRGECVASCRLPYELYKNNMKILTHGKYLLSTKELNTISHFKEIMDSDVVSLKIEGRMKSPEYVGFITKIYRTLMDKYYNNQELNIDEKTIDDLKSLYNRDFTSGYLFHETGHDLMNIKSPNHIGLPIGKVIEVNPKYIKIKLDYPLHQEDGIKFLTEDKGMIVNKLYNDKFLLTSKVEKGKIAILDNKIGLKNLSIVTLTTNHQLINKLNHYNEKKIPLNIKVVAKLNQKIMITAQDDQNNIATIYGDIISKSISRPVTDENIIAQISKMGNTPFIIDHLEMDCDSDIFISLKELNDLRRKIVEDLINKRTYITDKRVNKGNIKLQNNAFDKKLSILVRNEEQFKVAIDKKIDYIYVTDMSLYHKYKNLDNIYLRMGRVISNFMDMMGANILASELGAIHKYTKGNNVVSDYYLNITNNYSLLTLAKQGVKRITISPEANFNTNFISSVPLEMIIYGRLELMITKYCPIKMLVGNNRDNCNLCLKKDKYFLKSNDNKYYPIINEPHITHIMHYKNIDLISQIDEYYHRGISCFRIELFDENQEEMIKIIDKVRRMF